ncbi:IS30 family transposase [Corallococcus sp. CA041A]|uniref:IS30 family transposase n=1 Tax=Corallococcus sp. CA041A TaxID=2316727 RepID=UPI000EA144AA|nr:IS30 family transposase [Corallococcus sp. CA041A]RKH29757.1 IS30 family transposase [Corallococcus sp. CA041A]
MHVVKRRGLTPRERVDLWTRWKEGQSLSDIGRALGKAPASVFGYLAARGGIAPAARKRRPDALTEADREEISRGLSAGHSLRAIAERLGKAPSTLTREVARNGGRERYRAANAEARAWQKARRPKRCKLALHPYLQSTVAQKLQLDWSPEQIAGWLRREYKDSAMHVSHETLYKSLFIQARGVLKRELLQHLRSRRPMRRARASTTDGQRRGQIIGAVSIRERPAEAEDRAIPGHWEGDLLSGASNSHIATLVERHSRFTMLVKVEGKDAESVTSGLSRQVKTLPTALRRTLTWDRGMEMAQHRRFSIETNVQVYFCDPRSPWQRGTNENTNRLLRQYFPDGTDLSAYSQAQLNAVAARLNLRPRKTLGFLSPAEKLESVLL